MKELKRFFLLSMFMFIAVGFTACSDDDEGIDDVTSLYGLWEPVYTEGYEKGGGEDDTWRYELNASNDYDDYSRIEFNDDNYKIYSYRSGNWKIDGSGTFQVEGNKIYLDDDYEYPATIVKLNASQLIIESYEKEVYEGITYEYYEKVTYRKVN